MYQRGLRQCRQSLSSRPNAAIILRQLSTGQSPPYSRPAFPFSSLSEPLPSRARISTHTSPAHASWRHPDTAERRRQNIRSYSSSPSHDGEILCTTTEHSPGNNIATITVSNPTKLNIVNTPLLHQIISTCAALSKDAQLRAVVLAGAPPPPGKTPSWIGGMDIREMRQMTSYESAKQFITLVHHACDAFRHIPVPVIAKVHGFALGAGLEIMAACDLKIATRASVFGMPEVKIGLPSVVEAALMPAQMGMGRARRLMYLAENVEADVALRWGLIEEVAEGEEELEEGCREWVERLVSMGPKAIRSQKRLMQKWENCTPEQGIQAGVEALAATFADGGVEPREMMARFLNRRR